MAWLPRLSSRERIILEPKVFSERYIPETLLVREEEANALIRRYLLRMGSTGPVDVTLIFGTIGRVGIGKTTLARYVGRKLEKIAIKDGINFKSIYVNVYAAKNSQEVLEAIAKSLQPEMPVRGVGKLEVLRQIVDYLYRMDLHVLIILDEFQKLVEPWFSDDGLLYALLRVNEEIPPRDDVTRINFMLVAQDFTVLSRMRERLPQLESQIGYKLKLEPYRKNEIYNIIRQRAELGLRPGSWNDEILWTIAEEYGLDGSGHRPEGNARKAIVALRLAAEIAETEGSPVIDAVHLSKAFSNDLAANISETILRSLGKHKLLLLLAVAELTLEKRGMPSNFSTTGEVREKYEAMCELYGEKPRRHTQFNEYIRDLAHHGLIDARSSGKGMRGRTTLIRIPPEIPPDLLKEAIEEILSSNRAGEG